MPGGRPLGHDRVNAAVDVAEVIGDGKLAVLTGHPVRDYLTGSPLVKAVQGLDGNAAPVFTSRNHAQAFQLGFGVFRIAMKPDQQRSRLRG